LDNMFTFTIAAIFSAGVREYIAENTIFCPVLVERKVEENKVTCFYTSFSYNELLKC
jgi:hypothetical protein